MTMFDLNELNGTTKMETDEDIFAIIAASYSEPAATSVRGIYRIFRSEAPNQPIVKVWLKTLEHVLSVYQAANAQESADDR
jgi:hypothetical protein